MTLLLALQARVASAADLYAEIPALAADEEPAPWSIRTMAAERTKALGK
jgi:hypothetical protein